MLWIIRSNTSVIPLWTSCEPEPEILPGKCRSSLWWSDTHFFPTRAPKYLWHLYHLRCTTGLMRAAVSVQRARQELASVSCLVICLACWTLLLRHHQGPRQQGPRPDPDHKSLLLRILTGKERLPINKYWTKVVGTKKDCLYVCLGLTQSSAAYWALWDSNGM